jgi:hypothetical protein
MNLLKNVKIAALVTYLIFYLSGNVFSIYFDLGISCFH